MHPLREHIEVRPYKACSAPFLHSGWQAPLLRSKKTIGIIIGQTDVADIKYLAMTRVYVSASAGHDVLTHQDLLVHIRR